MLDTLVDPAVPDAAATEETLDARARAAYRRRLREVDALDELYESSGRRATSCAALWPAPPMSPRRRRSSGRGCASTKAIRRPPLLVADADPSLGAHLETSVQTGRVCLYAPADGRAWTIVAADDPSRAIRSSEGGRAERTDGR